MKNIAAMNYQCLSCGHIFIQEEKPWSCSVCEGCGCCCNCECSKCLNKERQKE